MHCIARYQKFNTNRTYILSSISIQLLDIWLIFQISNFLDKLLPITPSKSPISYVSFPLICFKLTRMTLAWMKFIETYFISMKKSFIKRNLTRMKLIQKKWQLISLKKIFFIRFSIFSLSLTVSRICPQSSIQLFLLQIELKMK